MRGDPEAAFLACLTNAPAPEPLAGNTVYPPTAGIYHITGEFIDYKYTTRI